MKFSIFSLLLLITFMGLTSAMDRTTTTNEELEDDQQQWKADVDEATVEAVANSFIVMFNDNASDDEKQHVKDQLTSEYGAEITQDFDAINGFAYNVPATFADLSMQWLQDSGAVNVVEPNRIFSIYGDAADNDAQ